MKKLKASHPTTKPARGTTAAIGKPVNLALQGGGAHGAFTWGVLDRLLDDDRFALEAISATSAGAMNAVVMAHGISLGGREGGRRKLEEFWREISRSSGSMFGGLPSPDSFPFSEWPMLAPWLALPTPAFLWFQSVSNYLSPYDLNPFDFNPLRQVLTSVVDFEHLQQCPITSRLFINATNVRSGKVKVFENHELSAEAVLASACLPAIFKAVEIKGEFYWDGGYSGNPAIFPLIYNGASRDVIIVPINPVRREKVPQTAAEIRDRMNEISFNAPLMGEMRAIAFVTKLMEENRLDASRYRRMLIHAIADDAEMISLSADTKYRTDWPFLTGLRDAGIRAAERWLTAHADQVGHKTTIDLVADYL
ncbi:MAG: patatin-like phospholipase family protein [Methylocystis sp.]|nr:patatin-like phospholipase family protein [Methylocystis sp.]MCA3585495.1 patatin-like phospholipase family protein [Methylocystis sp.]MCA3591435.1 patatin-like phospholipase family protein [Methylocystis sp.]